MAQDDPFDAEYAKRYGAGLSADEFDAEFAKRYAAPSQERPRTATSNLVRGLAQGLGTAGTSTLGAIGTLTGSQRLQDFARRSEEEMREFYAPQGRAGAIGTGAGRIAGELATGIVGGGLGVKAATRLSPRIAQAMAGASRVQRGLATAAANAPIDIVQGAKSEEGIILPGRLGSIVESVGLTGAAGALLPAARAARVPETPTAPRALPPGQYEMGPITTRLEPETDPRRMLPSTTARPTDVGPLQGPAIPMRGELPDVDVAQRLAEAAARVEQPTGIEVIRAGRRTPQQQAAFNRSIARTAEDVARDLRRRRALPTEVPEASRALEAAAEAGRRSRITEGLIVRPGVIAPELLAQGGGAVLGAGTGVATAPEGEDPFGLAGRAVLGAAAGTLAGRAALRGLPTGRTGIGQIGTSARTSQAPARATPLTEPVTDADRYANIGRMTSEEPELAGGLRETVQGAVESRQLGERLPPRGREVLGRLREAETEDMLKARVANLFGGQPSDIVARTAQGERVGRERLLRATEELLERQQRINDLNERLRSGLVVDADEVRRLESMRDAEREAAYDLFAGISAQKTETARDLAAMRFGVSLSDNPIVWKERLEELAKRPLTAEEIAQAEVLAARQDVNGLVKLGTAIRKATPTEKLVTLYKTSLLTSPKTHLANLFGNVGMAAVRQVRDVAATFADIALGAMTGQRTKVLDVGGRWQAISRGAARGIDDAKRVMRGELPSAEKFREIREVNYDSALANLYTKGVFRSLDASDRVFRGLAFAESIDEQARAIALNKGLRGEAADRFVRDVTRAPTTEMVADAMLAADIATFQQSGELSRVALSARRKLGALGDLLFPFAKTPANIAQTIVNYSPLGITGGQFRKNLKRVLAREATTSQQRMVAERIGEVSTGTALILLGYLKGQDGTMTGFFPADARTRAQWEAEGKIEGAVKVGNDWVQINRISPVGNMLTVGAALADVERGNPGMLAMALGSLAAPLSAITDLPMVQGLSNLTEIIDTQATPEQREAAATRLAGGIVGGAIPFSGLLRSAQQALDPTVREARTEGRVESAVRQATAGVPGLAQRLPAKVDPLGRPVERGGTALERFISPFQRRTDITTQDPVQRALAEANAVVGRVDRRKGESPDAYAERAQFTGTAVRRALETVVNSPAYASIDTMNVDRLRRGLAEQGVEVAGLSDAEIRNAWRSVALDRVIRRVKSSASRARPDTRSSLTRQLERAITR